jgi:glutamyl-tRNA synthetase
LHVGNVRTALFNWLFARKEQGAFVLRIEDTDAERSEKRFEEQLLEDLRWLGMYWDEGVSAGGKNGPYRQTERFHLYRNRVSHLIETGQAYYCFCSSEELEERRQKLKETGEGFQYSGKCRAIPAEEAWRRVEAGERATVRLRVREGSVNFQDLVFGFLEIDAATIGDFILLRSDGSAQYNLACVVDDSDMGISHVIRGEGHISNTYRQILIYESLGLALPRFAHLSTILGPDGSKLSKRHGATSISELRNAGYLPEAVLNYLALLGWAPPQDGDEILASDEIVEQFQLENVSRSPATFDAQKLRWINRGHLKSKSADVMAVLARDYLVRDQLIPQNPSPEVMDWVASMIQVILNYLDTLGDLSRASEHVFQFTPEQSLDDREVVEIIEEEGAVEVIRVFAQQILESGGPVDFETYRESVMETMKRTGLKGKKLFRPIRIAVTARASGPELEQLIPVLEVGSRLELPARVVGVKERVQLVSRRMDL